MPRGSMDLLLMICSTLLVQLPGRLQYLQYPDCGSIIMLSQKASDIFDVRELSYGDRADGVMCAQVCRAAVAQRGWRISCSTMKHH